MGGSSPEPINWHWPGAPLAVSVDRSELDAGGLSHRDLYMRLGELMGQVESIRSLLEDKRKDMAWMANRINELEKKVAIGVFLAVVVSILLPVATTIAATYFTTTLSGEEISLLKDEIAALREMKRRREAGMAPSNRFP